MRSALVAALLASASAQAAFDCGLRNLSLHFARSIQPARSAAALQEVADALEGSPQFGGFPAGCNLSAAVPAPGGRRALSRALHSRPLPAAKSFYVSPAGSDAGDGSVGAPFRTVARGVAAARGGGTVVLRAGTYFLGEPGQGAIELTPADSGLTVMAFPGEEAWISGARQLNLSWSPSPLRKSPSDNIFVASTSGLAALSVPTGLRAQGRRLIRARFPNTDPELGYGPSLSPTAWMLPAFCYKGVCANPPTRFEPDEPSRANETKEGTTFILGYGGDGCSEYSPPAGFNCVDNQRWGGVVPRWPAGFVASQAVLPHTPYSPAVADARNPAQANCWKDGGWFTRHFAIKAYDAASGNFTFGVGGFQGAEGDDDSNSLTIENVREELDAPAEWWFDAAAQELHVWNNATGAPASDGSLVATQLQKLFVVSGSQAAPVTDLTFSAVGFRDTALTLLEPHSMPSSGDWAIQRNAALFFEGTVGLTIEGCVFERIDGLSVFLSGFHRGAKVVDSEFAWLGETAVALWGYTRGSPVPGMGPDTTGGDQPRGTVIARNYFHELGIMQKQSSAVFQAECGLSSIEHNIFINGPRSAINFNDGSMGGSNLTANLWANFCREQVLAKSYHIAQPAPLTLNKFPGLGRLIPPLMQVWRSWALQASAFDTSCPFSRSQTNS